MSLKPSPSKPSPSKPGTAPAPIPFRVPAVIGQELARTLSDRIIYLDLAPGSRLGEDELCAEYQVSRSPLREAFRALEADGLVIRSVRRGVHVTPMSRRDLREVYACRVMLEGLAAREAAVNATPAEVAHLATLIAGMTAALKRKQDQAFFDNNVAFTQAIHRVSANATLMRVAAGIEKQALRYRYFAHTRTPDMRETAFEGHSQVFQAVCAGDPARAEREGQASIRRAHAVILKVVEAQWPAAEDTPGRSLPWDACGVARRQATPVSSRRTIAAPSASARNFPKARSRGRYFIPQSGAGIRRSAATCASPLRMRAATISAVSTSALPRSSTPSRIDLPSNASRTRRSSFGCAASIEICCAMHPAKNGRIAYACGLSGTTAA